MLARFRKISLFMAYAVATIPLWHYISEGHILLLMTAVIVFAYLNVVLSSVDAAKSILSSEKAKTPLPRWLPKKPKYEKWWLIVRHTLKWHLLLVPAKMGLALGFVHWLYHNIFSWKFIFHEAYSYYGYIAIQPYPQSLGIFIALFVAIVFACLETCLIASLSILVVTSGSLVKSCLKILFLRLIFILASLGFLILLPSGGWSILSDSSCSRVNLMISHSVGYSAYIKECNNDRFRETIYTSFMTSLDQSVLLNANIMRPLTIYWTDNRLFVLRQCVAGILGIFLYLGTIWAILWFA